MKHNKCAVNVEVAEEIRHIYKSPEWQVKNKCVPPAYFMDKLLLADQSLYRGLQ